MGRDHRSTLIPPGIEPTIDRVPSRPPGQVRRSIYIPLDVLTDGEEPPVKKSGSPGGTVESTFVGLDAALPKPATPVRRPSTSPAPAPLDLYTRPEPEPAPAPAPAPPRSPAPRPAPEVSLEPVADVDSVPPSLVQPGWSTTQIAMVAGTFACVLGAVLLGVWWGYEAGLNTPRTLSLGEFSVEPHSP